MLLKEILRWVERRAIRLGRNIKAHANRQRPSSPNVFMPHPPQRAFAVADAPTLDTLGWENFELLAGEIFRRQGNDIEIVSGLGADGGNDLTILRNGETRLVQCKNLRAGSKVTVAAMRDFYGLIVSEGASGGIFITTGTYSRDALEFAAGKPIELLGRPEVERLVAALARPGENLCDVSRWIDGFTAAARVAGPSCPRCRTAMKLRRGPTGKSFWGCSSFPRCKATRDARAELVRARSYQRA